MNPCNGRTARYRFRFIARADRQLTLTRDETRARVSRRIPSGTLHERSWDGSNFDSRNLAAERGEEDSFVVALVRLESFVRRARLRQHGIEGSQE